MEGVQEILVPGVPSLAPGCALSEARLGPRRQAQEMAREGPWSSGDPGGKPALTGRPREETPGLGLWLGSL